jgi:Family of unknown function (DUF5647)
MTLSSVWPQGYFASGRFGGEAASQLSKLESGLYICCPGPQESVALVSLRLREGADKMKRESVVRKNLDLLDEFMKYAFDHPEILDTIPRDRTLVVLPEGDPALERQNRKTLRRLKATDEKTITMRLKATKRKVSKVG